MAGGKLMNLSAKTVELLNKIGDSIGALCLAGGMLVLQYVLFGFGLI
jgi:hypothetical protein